MVIIKKSFFRLCLIFSDMLYITPALPVISGWLKLILKNSVVQKHNNAVIQFIYRLLLFIYTPHIKLNLIIIICHGLIANIPVIIYGICSYSDIFLINTSSQNFSYKPIICLFKFIKIYYFIYYILHSLYSNY